MRPACQLALLVAALIASAAAQQTTVTGTIKDLSGAVVTSGEVTFDLQPGVDTTISGNARFVPSTVTCLINGSGQLTNATGGACTVEENTAITPSGTYYRVTIEPYGAPSSQFNWYAVTSTQDITTVVPTPGTAPAYTFADTISNQTIAGTKTFSGQVNAATFEQVRYADQFAGADMGAKINAAIAALGAQGGRVVVPAGGYSYATTIVKPRNVLIQGASRDSTILTYTPTSGAAVVIADSLSNDLLQAPMGGLRDLYLSGPGSGSSAIGVYFGGDPSGVLSSTNAWGDTQVLDEVRVSLFGDALKYGNNAFLDSCSQCEIDDNGTAFFVPSGLSNNGESFAFYGGQVDENGTAFSLLGFLDLYLHSTSVDFTAPGYAFDIAGSATVGMYGVHLENQAGSFLRVTAGTPQITISGGQALFDASTGTDPEMFGPIGGANTALSMIGLYIGSNHTLSAVVNFTATGNPKLTLLGLPFGGSAASYPPVSGASPWPGEFIANVNSAGGGEVITARGGEISSQATGAAYGMSFSALDPAQATLSCWHGAGTPDSLGNWNAKVCATRDGSSNYDSELQFFTETKSSANNTDTSAVEAVLHANGGFAWGGGPAIASSGSVALASQLPLSGTTASIGGSALAGGACTTGTASVAGSTTSMAVAVSPAADPGTGFTWEGWVSAAGTVSVRLCNVTAGSLTPTAEAYNVRVVQ